MLAAGARRRWRAAPRGRCRRTAAFVCCGNTVRSAVKRASPRSKSSFSSRTRSIMCSTTSWFLPRSARSSASCSAMPACRASRSARTPPTSARTSACVAAPTMSRLAGMSFARQRVLERGQAAPREQRVVAVDLGEQRLLRRHGEDLRRRRCRAARADAVDLARDLGVDRRRRASARPRGRRSCSGPRGGRPSARRRRRRGAGSTPRGRSCVTPASAARMNSTACALGSRLQRELRLGADRVQARRVEDHEALLQQRMREVDDRVAPARDVDRRLAAGRAAARGGPRRRARP